jgi:hypothetical protein
MKYRGIRNYSFPRRKLIIQKEYICVIGISKHEKLFLKQKILYSNPEILSTQNFLMLGAAKNNLKIKKGLPI